MPHATLFEIRKSDEEFFRYICQRFNVINAHATKQDPSLYASYLSNVLKVGPLNRDLVKPDLIHGGHKREGITFHM